MKITRNGLLLTIDTPLIPAQGSSDVPIEFENDTDYSGYTIEPRVAYYSREVPQSAVCQYENGQIIVPKEAFLQFGVILIAIALIDPSNSNHIEVTNALELTVQGAPLGDVTLPDTPTWQAYVTNLVNQLTASITAEIQEKLDNGDFVPNFSIGTVSTLEPDEQATATITGTNQAPVLNLGIPQGEKGDKGDKGEQGIQGVGVPDGGTDGQLLIKSTATSYDTEWVSPENIDYISSLYNRLYRPNLLINGDFQVNQRGKTTYETTIIGVNYNVDMWFINSNPSSGVTIGVSNNGITVNGIANLFQAIKLDRNKQYTIVAKINDNIRSFTFTPNDTSQSNEYFEINGQRTVVSGYDLVGIKYQGDTTTIEYVDLFEGSIAYPHVKEDHAIALTRCQTKIYALKSTTSVIPLGYGYCENSSTIFVGVDLTMLESKPTMEYLDADLRLISNIGYDIGSIAIKDYNAGKLYLQITPSSSISSDKIGGLFILGLKQGKTIVFTCEPV